MKVLATTILATLALTGCGKIDPGLAKTMAITDSQRAAIEARICSYDGNDCFLPIMVNIKGGTQVAVVDDLPGKAKYAACGACHGAQGQGGVGPMLAGQTVDYIVDRLRSYKAGETIGSQSNLMWGQAAVLTEDDIADLAEYIATL